MNSMLIITKCARYSMVCFLKGQRIGFGFPYNLIGQLNNEFFKRLIMGVFQSWFAARDLVSFVARARANQKSRKANFTNICDLFAEFLFFVMNYKNYLILFLGSLSRFLMY